MPVTAFPLNANTVYIDTKTGRFTVEGIRSFMLWHQRMGGNLAPSNNELQGFAVAAQATADAAQDSASAAQGTANTAQSTAVAASVAATNAQDDANTAQATADGAVIDAATAQAAADAAQIDATQALADAAAAQADATDALTNLSVPAGRVPYGSGSAITSEAAFAYDETTNTLTVERVKGSLWSGVSPGVTVADDGVNTQIGLYGVTAITRPTTAFAAATFTANAGTAVNDASTFDGYTIKQVVKALRNIGILT